MVELTLFELSGEAGGKVLGNGDVVLKGVAPLDAAGPDEISFFMDMKRKDALAACKAGALVTPVDFGLFQGPSIETDNPYLVFARIVALFHPVPKVEETRIHASAVVSDDVVLDGPVEIGPTAVVEAGVTIGGGTTIGPGATVGKGSVLGNDCRIHARAVLYQGVILGDRVEVHSGAVLGSDGFGNARDGSSYVKFPQVGRLVVEDDVEIGANTTIDRAALGETRICRGVKLDNLVMIAHNCIIGEDTAFAAQVGLAGSTTIGARCMLGGQAGVAGHCTVGDNCIIYAKAGIRGNIAPGSRMFGAPAGPAGEMMRNMQAFNRLSKMMRRLKALEKRVDS